MSLSRVLPDAVNDGGGVFHVKVTQENNAVLILNNTALEVSTF